MKAKYILAIGLIGVLIAVVLTMYGDASSYVTFDQAALNPGREYHVVGELEKDSTMHYDPIKDPNHLEFFLRDSLNNVCKVVFNNPKPADLDRSEKVVIVGKMNPENNVFHASSILLKCPSKYNDGTLETKEYKTGV